MSRRAFQHVRIRPPIRVAPCAQARVLRRHLADGPRLQPAGDRSCCGKARSFLRPDLMQANACRPPPRCGSSLSGYLMWPCERLHGIPVSDPRSDLAPTSGGRGFAVPIVRPWRPPAHRQAPPTCGWGPPFSDGHPWPPGPPSAPIRVSSSSRKPQEQSRGRFARGSLSCPALPADGRRGPHAHRRAAEGDARRGAKG